LKIGPEVNPPALYDSNSTGQYMKILRCVTILMIIMTIFVSLSKGQVQVDISNNFNSSRNHVVDIDQVPYEAMEEGIIYIKLDPSWTDYFSDQQVTLQKTGIVSFSIPSIDALNERFLVDNFNPLFSGRLIDPANHERHREYNLHLWIALRIPGDYDIKEVVKAYQQSPDIQIAEPVYKIRHVDHSVKVPEINPGRTWFPDRGDMTETVRKEYTRLNNAWDSNKSYLDHVPFVETYSSFPHDQTEPNIIQKSEELPEPWIPNDPQINSQKGHYESIDLFRAWTIERGSRLVVVSVHDSGILFTHPDLENAMWEGIGPAGAATQPANHGTHVAGTVAAVTNNGLGGAGIAGGSGPDGGARLMSVDIFNDEDITTFGGYVYAADLGVPISNNSWSYENSGSFNRADLDGIDYFVDNGGGDIMDGGIVFFSAGNDNNDERWYPGYYENAIAVAAVTNDGIKSTFSNYGDWIGISAPGSGIYSTTLNNNYGNSSGTSMACPHVSGVAALVLSYIPGMITAAQLKEILMLSADTINHVNPNYIDQLGAGRVNAYRSLVTARNYGVLNPAGLSALTEGEAEIRLNWGLNVNENQILLAYNTTGNFDPPTGEPQVGDEISPGTFVLYVGTESEFVHQDLMMGTRYYYKVWSYDGERYSLGITAFTDTDCGVFALPLYQNFSEMRIPNCWETYSVGDGESGQVWNVGRISFGGLNTEDFNENYAFIDSDFFGPNFSQNADLRSPLIDFSDLDDVTLSFRHFYRHRSGSRAAVYYSLDFGEEWTLIHEWQSTTTNPEYFSVHLPELANKNNVYLKWNYQGSDAYYWSVDRILISSATSVVTDEFSIPTLNAFPNPVRSGQNITISGIQTTQVNYGVYNQIGSLVARGVLDTENNAGIIALPELPAGMYILRVETFRGWQSQKILVLP
jgi:subtilisin family serine protease